jgi:Fuc2NAc and GlcNAc transferase
MKLGRDMLRLLVWSFVSLTIALLLTAYVRRFAVSRGLLDRPNARSSHSIPTPRGGGLAIVISATLSLLGLAFFGGANLDVAITLLAGGSAVAIIGFADDRNAVSARVRFGVHLAAAVWAVWSLGGLHRLQVGSLQMDLGFGGDVLAVIAIVWALNLFNFMDGIDGMAGSEAVFVSLAGTCLALTEHHSPAVAAPALVVAGATLGFLAWNWPPAKIFMGDAGSGYLGYMIATLALLDAQRDSAAVFIWLILGGLFFLDATITLVRRVFRGERVYLAHRTHAYQWLSRRWKSHLKVTVVVWIINVGWLFPMAWLCSRYPTHAIAIVVLALTPLAVLAVTAGAGRPETERTQIF